MEKVFSAVGLVEVPFADHTVFAGFGVEIVDIEIGANIETFVMNGKIDRSRAFLLTTADSMKDVAGPDQHTGAIVSQLAIDYDFVGGNIDFDDAAVFWRVNLYVALT